MITIASDSPCGQTRERSCVLTTHPAKLVKTVEETLPPVPSSGLPGSHTIPCWPLQGKLTATGFPFQTHTCSPAIILACLLWPSTCTIENQLCGNRKRCSQRWIITLWIKQKKTAYKSILFFISGGRFDGAAFHSWQRAKQVGERLPFHTNHFSTMVFT